MNRRPPSSGHRPSHRRHRGMSLVELLVAVAISGLTVVAISTLTTRALEFQKANDLLMTAEEIRRYLVEATNCEKTMTPGGVLSPACSGSGFMEVKDNAGQVIVGKPSTRFDKFLVRASCPAVGGERRLHLEQLFVRADGAPAADPLSGQPSTWKPLLKEGLSPCSSVGAPDEQVVYDKLDMDSATALSIATFFATGNGPVIACADSWPDSGWETETSLLYHGFAQCPRGYTIVGGGVDCSWSSNGDPAVNILPAPVSAWAPYTNRRNSWKIFNDPVYDEFVLNGLIPQRKINAWHGGCCTRILAPIGIFQPEFARENRVYARCRRNFSG